MRSIGFYSKSELCNLSASPELAVAVTLTQHVSRAISKAHAYPFRLRFIPFGWSALERQRVMFYLVTSYGGHAVEKVPKKGRVTVVVNDALCRCRGFLYAFHCTNSSFLSYYFWHSLWFSFIEIRLVNLVPRELCTRGLQSLLTDHGHLSSSMLDWD